MSRHVTQPGLSHDDGDADFRSLSWGTAYVLADIEPSHNLVHTDCLSHDCGNADFRSPFWEIKYVCRQTPDMILSTRIGLPSGISYPGHCSAFGGRNQARDGKQNCNSLADVLGSEQASDEPQDFNKSAIASV